MSEITSAMQAEMNQRLSAIRISDAIGKLEGQMAAAVDRIEQRPSFSGCDALKKTESFRNNLKNQRDSAFETVSMVAGGIAMGGMTIMGSAADMAVDTIANRRSTKAPVHLTKKFSPKQESEIREKNQQDLRLFAALQERLGGLHAFQSCGVTHIDIQKDDSVRPSADNIKMPKLDRKLSAEEHEELAKIVKFANSPHAPSAPRMAG